MEWVAWRVGEGIKVKARGWYRASVWAGVGGRVKKR